MSSDRDSGYTGLITIWPEWTEADLLTEKWDVQAAGASTKSAKDPKVKGASFEDPEGRTRLPHSLLRVLKDWKRPQELFGENLCLVRNVNRINLRDPNAHIMHSEFIRHYLSDITLLWYLAQRKKLSQKSQVVPPVLPTALPVPPLEITTKTSAGSQHKDSKHNIAKDLAASKVSQGADPPPKALCFEDPLTDWAPWNLIYGGPPPAPRTTNVKGEPPVAHVVTNLPQYNANGKYAVKLYWMGTWRKVVVDDFIPVDEANRPLLPVCEEGNEIWPLILTKAVLKVVSLDFGGGSGSSEIGDAGLILHVLTGYIPHVLYLDHPKWTRKAVWNKLQALLSLNKQSPPEDILTALAENFDIRTRSAMHLWRAQNDPAYIQKLDAIRANRLLMAPVTAPTIGLPALPPPPNLSAPNTLAPKPLVRSVSARSSSNAPRKLEMSNSPSAATPSLSAPFDAPRTRNPKTPEVLVCASYHSAHHEMGVFDHDQKSRSDKLYDNGFLRAESHPILLRGVRDVQPCKKIKFPVPRYKLFRPLRLYRDRYSQIILRGHKRREHPIRSVDFLSLLWKEKGRLTNQTPNKAHNLIAGEVLDMRDSVRWKPTDGFRLRLPAIPENCRFPRRKTKSHLLEVIVKPPSPPQSPPHEEKPTAKAKLTDPSKPQANQPPPEPFPIPPIPAPPTSNEELQKHCRLNRGSLEFNRFYESIETIYIFTKPETFDYQSPFSLYQANILTDGRPPPAKKKGGEQIAQQSTGTSEGSRTAPTKPPSTPNQGKFGKVTADLPSPFMMVDNPYPTCVVIGVSTVSRSFFQPKTEVKSQERMSIVPATIDELKGIERPAPITILLKSVDWTKPKCDEPSLVSVKTSSVQGVCFQIPTGRHYFRLKVVCPGRRELEPHGYFIRAFSRDPVHIGPEESILKLAAADSYQYSVLARKTALPLLRWWKTNGIPAFSHPPHREMINALGLEEDAFNKNTRRIFFDAMLAAVYSAIQVYLREFCTTKGAFTLRAFMGDLVTRNVLNLNKSQLSKKDSKGTVAVLQPMVKLDAHAPPRQAEGKKVKLKPGDSSNASPSSKASSAASDRDGSKDRTLLAKKEKPIAAKKVMDKNEIKAANTWGLYFQIAKASNVLQARKAGSKKKEIVLKLAQDMFDAILRNEQAFMNCFFRNLCRGLPPDWLDLNFFYDQERRFVSRDITGTFPDLPANTWKLFFRDIFTVQEPLLVAFRLTTAVVPMRLTIVNNDTGQPIPSNFFQPQPFLFEKNACGYSAAAEAKSGVLGWRSAPWCLRIVQALDPFKHEAVQAEFVTIRFSSATPQVNFITKELSDYFLPDLSVDPIIGRIAVTVRAQSLATISFTTSNADARFELRILNRGCCDYKTHGRGIIVLPAFLFKSLKPPQPETFFIQVTCIEDSWPLTGPEWKSAYAEKNKRIAVEYGRETPSTPPSTSPVRGEKPVAKKPAKSSRERDKEDRSDKDSLDSTRSNKKETKDKIPTFDITRPHWTAKLVLDSADSDFQCKIDLSIDEMYRTDLYHSIAFDASLLQRGREFREDLMKKNKDKTEFVPPDSPDYPGWMQGTQKPCWPEPIARFPLTFDLAGFHRNAAGDASDEVDDFVHQGQMRTLSTKYSEAMATKEAHLAGERNNRDRKIHEQSELIKELVETAISDRREYLEQRDIRKKQLDERALEDEKLGAPVVVKENNTKLDDKQKKGKKA